MLRDIFSDVLEITVYSSIIIILLLLLERFVKKRYGVKWRYFIWLIIAIRLIIPVNFSILERAVTLNAPDAVISLYSDPDISTQNNAEPTYNIDYSLDLGIEPNSGMMRTFTAMELMSVIWIAGIAVCLIYQIVSYMLFKRRLRRWRAPVDEETHRIFDELQNDMSITRDIKLYRCSEIDSPMLIGFIKPIILLPRNNLAADQLSPVLRHELVHYSRHDLWYKLTLTLANAVHWFNPLMYIMVKVANNDLELICDRITISATGSAQVYADAILTIMKNRRRFKPAMSTHFLGGRRAMKERFKTIFDQSAKKRGAALMTIVLTISILGGALVTCGFTDNTTETQIKSIEETAAELYELHSPYIGDHVNDIEILKRIPFLVDMPYDHIEIDTDDNDTLPEKYGIALYFPSDPEGKTSMQQTQLRAAGMIFLALVDNAGYAYFTTPHGSRSSETVTVLRGNCDEIYGHIFTNAGNSIEEFTEFYRYITENIEKGLPGMPLASDIDNAIDSAIISENKSIYSPGNISISAHETIYETVTSDNIYTEYVYTLFTQYSELDGIMTTSAGTSGPAVICFEKAEDGTYKMLEYLDDMDLKDMDLSKELPKEIFNQFMNPKYADSQGIYERLRVRSDAVLRRYLDRVGNDTLIDGDYYSTILN